MSPHYLQKHIETVDKCFYRPMRCFCLSYCVITSVFSLGSVVYQVNVNQRRHLSYSVPVYASFLFLNKTSSEEKRTKLPLEFQLGSQQWALSSEWVSCFFFLKKTTQCETEPTLGTHTTHCVAQHIRDSSESPFKFCLGLSAGVGIRVLSTSFFFFTLTV